MVRAANTTLKAEGIIVDTTDEKEAGANQDRTLLQSAQASQ